MTRGRQQQNRESFYEYTLELMKETIRDVSLECDREAINRHNENFRQERAAICKDQGDAVVFALNTLPFLRSLHATDAVITAIPSTVNPASPKLTLHALNLGANVHSDAYFQQICHTEEFTMRGGFYIRYEQPKSVFINMPHTTFGDIHISDERKHSIIKLYTTTGINYNVFGSTLTREHYDNWTASNVNLVKIAICCAGVKKLRYGSSTIGIRSN